MNILLINGQTHKGSTYNLSKKIIEGLIEEEDDTVTEMNLNNLKFCRGCFNCIIKGEKYCPDSDGVSEITEAINKADVLVINSPNYCMEMSGQLKNFFDHMAFRWLSHRPQPDMNKKVGVAVSTTAGLGAKGTAKQIKRQMFWWGIDKNHIMAESVSAMSWEDINPVKKEKMIKKAGKLAKKIKKSTTIKRKSFKMKVLFYIMKLQQKNNTWNLLDRKHWEDSGWL